MSSAADGRRPLPRKESTFLGAVKKAYEGNRPEFVTSSALVIIWAINACLPYWNEEEYEAYIFSAGAFTILSVCLMFLYIYFLGSMINRNWE